MADVCSVQGGAGRKILNLIKGIEIEPATQHRSHCTPPHNSREHKERPVPEHISPTNSDKTQTRAGLPGPLRQEPNPNRPPRASADPLDPSRRRLAPEKSPQHQRDPPDPLRRQAGTEKCPQASANPTDPFVNGPNSKKGPSAPQILGQQP